ncbi:complement regulator-acquiring protein (plasmid) [Borreliella sinica]|uniref:complement regulator-acquiring protein n=1 Tax=Borreliella sinica TaxID=87162 RepID=UPI002A23F667|nr:complement regulator-acquiring protein [Borreliella sinica]WPM06424.1 complement regulator-acquiring protein [Borreliella sinica]
MTKNKLNIIKLNIITTILTLTCISCDANKIDPQLKRQINPKETAKNLQNKPQDSKSSSQKSQDSKSSSQKSQDPIVLKLKTIGKSMKAQKEKEHTQIANINAQFDFLDTFKINPQDSISKDKQLLIKRIIYSSLNYDTSKIATLKEILEKLIKNDQHKNIAERFINHTSWSIQFHLDSNLDSIENELSTLNQENSRWLLIQTEYQLKEKQRFVKALNETIEAYNQNHQNIKTDAAKLASHMNEYFKDTTTLKPL